RPRPRCRHGVRRAVRGTDDPDRPAQDGRAGPGRPRDHRRRRADRGRTRAPPARQPRVGVEGDCLPREPGRGTPRTCPRPPRAVGRLAGSLGWGVGRVESALELAARRPDIADPVAPCKVAAAGISWREDGPGVLHRVEPDAYLAVAKAGRLTDAQRAALVAG